MVDDLQGEKIRKELREIVKDFQKKLEMYYQLCFLHKLRLIIAVSERTPVLLCLRRKGLSTREPNQIERSYLHSLQRSLKNKLQAKKRRECTYC